MKRIGLLVLAAALFIGAYAANPEEPKAPNAPITATVKVETDNQSKDLSKSSKDSITYSKLSADQIYELKELELRNEVKKIENEKAIPLPSIIILLICALPFLFAGTIIIINVRSKKEESKRRYDLYSKSLEMGQTVPEHFFDEPRTANPTSNLKRGIIWLAVGLAVLVSFLVMHQRDAVILGIVPAFVGAGYLLVHFLDKPKSDSTAE